jgi:hypothetical protein
MLRRTRMALGISSRRRCMASITASCSHRVMRRCLLGVHIAFIAQVPQLLDQYRLSVSPFSTVV